MKKINPEKLRKEYDHDTNVWHKASDPPPMNAELNCVSDRIIIQFDDGYYIIGRYYSGPDGNFYEDQYKELLRRVVAWAYLPEYDLEDE